MVKQINLAKQWAAKHAPGAMVCAVIALGQVAQLGVESAVRIVSAVAVCGASAALAKSNAYATG